MNNRETDRPLSHIVEAALGFWASGDGPWKDGDPMVEGDDLYWSDEDKATVIELSENLNAVVLNALKAKGWRQG